MFGLDGCVGAKKVSARQIGKKFQLKEHEVTAKTGITNLYRFGKNESLVKKTAQICLRLTHFHNISLKSIDGIFGSSNPTTETLMPNYTTSVAQALGLTHIISDQIGMGCGGGLQALRAAYNQLVLRTLQGKQATYLVFTGDAKNLILDSNNRKTGLLFSEGLGVLLVTNNPKIAKNSYLIEKIETASFITNANVLRLENPYWSKSKPSLPYLQMDGKKVYEFGVNIFPHLLKLIGETKIRQNWFIIPHQANLNMLNEMAQKNNIPKNIFYTRGIKTIGNTSGASIFLGLIDSLRHKKIQKKKIFLGTFGAELTTGALLLKPKGDPRKITPPTNYAI